MIFSCLKSDLANALQTVQKAISTKPSTTQVLSGIHLTANEDNTLTLQATDYEIAIINKINANVEVPGKTVVSGKYFIEVIRKTSGETVNIDKEPDGNKLRIQSGHSQITLVTMYHEEFPTIKPLIGGNFIKIDCAQFHETIKKTTFACSNDEGRPLFTGCLFEITNQQLCMVATDTHRMAIKQLNFQNVADDVKIVVPSKILNEIVRITSNESEKDIQVLWEKNEIAFLFGDLYIKSRLIEGQFPNYRNVVPSMSNLDIVFDRKKLEDTVERVSLLSSGIYNVMKISVTGDNIVFSTNNPDIGRATEVIEAKVTGSEMEVIFNSKYILDIIKHLDSEEVLIKLNTPNSAALIVNPADDSYKYVLTPVRTNNM